MITNVAILAVVILAAGILLLPRVANARGWRAATTPLASIIGSGFLVLGPILDASYGAWAPLVMALLCAVAYLFGSAIRFNIAAIDVAQDARSAWEDRIEAVSSLALAFAYVISVAYYLNLFGAFGVSLTPLNDPLHAKLLTSAVYAAILGIGWRWGFRALERTEQVSVGAKLAIIAGLLVGLAIHFTRQAAAGALVLNPLAIGGWHAATLALGLIVTVQGFETSRYLGKTYDAATRIRSMKVAQWLASAIYLVYVLLLAFAFKPDPHALSETAIIDLMRIVAPILPILLVAAALTAQFSAAIADTSGGGGLIAELTRRRIKPAMAYALITGAGLLLTWSLNVFEIIAYASRAFALYYALQCAIAALAAQRRSAGGWRSRGYWALMVLALAMALFGAAVEA